MASSAQQQDISRLCSILPAYFEKTPNNTLEDLFSELGYSKAISSKDGLREEWTREDPPSHVLEGHEQHFPAATIFTYFLEGRRHIVSVPSEDHDLGQQTAYFLEEVARDPDIRALHIFQKKEGIAVAMGAIVGGIFEFIRTNQTGVYIPVIGPFIGATLGSALYRMAVAEFSNLRKYERDFPEGAEKLSYGTEALKTEQRQLAYLRTVAKFYEEVRQTEGLELIPPSAAPLFHTAFATGDSSQSVNMKRQVKRRYHLTPYQVQALERQGEELLPAPKHL